MFNKKDKGKKKAREPSPRWDMCAIICFSSSQLMSFI